MNRKRVIFRFNGPALGAFNQYVRETDRYPGKPTCGCNRNIPNGKNGKVFERNDERNRGGLENEQRRNH